MSKLLGFVWERKQTSQAVIFVGWEILVWIDCHNQYEEVTNKNEKWTKTYFSFSSYKWITFIFYLLYA